MSKQMKKTIFGILGGIVFLIFVAVFADRESIQVIK